MTKDEVQALVLEQIGDTSNETNAHGISARDSLVDPVQVEMIYPAFRDGQSIDSIETVWLVLEEVKDGSGYKIVFDEADRSFGLATPGKDGEPAIIVSSCDSLMDLVRGM